MTMKKHLIIIVIIMMLYGCASLDSPNIFRGHSEIRVPEEYRTRASCCVNGIDSLHRMYVVSYEQGWWACVKNYIKDINYTTQPSDLSNCGWDAEIEGYYKGYMDAEKSIRNNIHKFGKKSTQDYLIELCECK
jgi:hypothetical protein